MKVLKNFAWNLPWNLKSEFAPGVIAAAEIALLAGDKVRSGKWSNEAMSKHHATFGEATVTESDRGSEGFIIDRLSREFPHAIFIAEESADESNAYLQKMQNAPTAFGVDPIDGTTDFVRSIGTWSVSIGSMRRGQHEGGAISCPDLRGGLLIMGERGNGVFLWEHDDAQPKPVRIDLARPKKPVIWVGMDVARSSAYKAFVATLPKELDYRGVAASCATGMALLAAGRIDAFAQSPQMPWDFFAGYPLVLETGQKMICYHIENGKIIQLPKPTLESYRSDKQMLGFFAGKPDLVDPLFEHLLNTYGRKVHLSD